MPGKYIINSLIKFPTHTASLAFSFFHRSVFYFHGGLRIG